MSVYDDEKTDSFDDIVNNTWSPEEQHKLAQDADEQGRYDREFDDRVKYEKEQEEQQGKTAGKEELSSQEAKGEGGFFREDSKESDASEGAVDKADTPKKKRGWKGLGKRAKAGILGGVMGLGVGGGIFGFTVVSGPLEFIHLSHILHDTHLSQQEDASDGRMGKLIRGMREGNIGTTRLGWLSNKYYKNTLSKLAAKGIEPKYGSLSLQEGMVIDTEHPDSPFKGMSPEEAAAAFQERLGSKVNVTIEGGKVIVSSDSLVGPRDINKLFLKEVGFKGIGYAARMRVLGKFGLVGFHNLSKRLDVKSTSKLSDYFKEKWTKLFKGEEPKAASINTDQAKEDTGQTDQNGDPQTKPAPGESGELKSASVRDTLKSMANSKGGKITGGVATAIGILCVLKTVNDKIGDIRYVQMIKPLVNIGLRMISVGDQIESGQDVDPQELQYLSQYFNDNGKDSAGNQVRPKSNWNDAKPIRENTDQQGGIDMDQGTKDSLGQGSPSWLSWTDNPVMDGLCSTLGTVVTGVVSFALTIFSGGTFSAVVGFIGGLVIFPKIIDWLANLVAGDAINVAEARGATFGNYADYGAALGGNAAALQFGGTELTQAEQTALLDNSQEIRNKERSQESVFARAFDPYDPASVTGKIIDQNRGSFTGNVAALTQGFIHVASTVFRFPATLISGKAHAAGSYKYPFPIFGFSIAEQNNPAVADPFQNATDVGNILGDGSSPQAQAYIKKAMDCFGVKLERTAASASDPTLVWDAVTTVNISEGVEGQTPGVYGGSYDADNCKDSGDSDWLKIRFFILDTATFEGYACAEFDDTTSCINNNSPVAAQN